MQTEWLPSTHQSAGQSTVRADGTPTIKLNPKYIHHDVILHELYHLQLILRGYPILAWVFPKTMGGESDRASRNQLAAKLYDPIVHSVFYRETKRKGIDPGKTYKNNIVQQMRNGTITKLIPLSDDREIALNFFGILTEFGDNDVVKKFERLLLKSGKQKGLQLGRELDQTIKRLKPDSPESTITTFVTCLNLLYKNELTFSEQRPWGSRRKGTFDEVFAIIDIEPAS